MSGDEGWGNREKGFSLDELAVAKKTGIKRKNYYRFWNMIPCCKGAQC
jgi:hypothetical protein